MPCSVRTSALTSMYIHILIPLHTTHQQNFSQLKWLNFVSLPFLTSLCHFSFSLPLSFPFLPHHPQWCEARPECHRLKLKDFLAMPMQRLMKYPLLFTAISKETTDLIEKQQLEHIVSMNTCTRHFLAHGGEK